MRELKRVESIFIASLAALIGGLAASLLYAAVSLSTTHRSFTTPALVLVCIYLVERLYLLVRQRFISHPPGWGLRRFAEVCFSKKTFTQVLEPALSDMQKEHFDALAAGRPWKARMVLVRGYWSFWSAAFAQLPISFARRVYEVWKATKTGS